MLPRLRRVIATSRPVAERLNAEFGVARRGGAAGRARPAAQRAGRRRASPCSPSACSPGARGTTALLRAMARLTDLRVAAGRSPAIPAASPSHAAELAALIEELGLGRAGRRCSPIPTPAALEHAWRSAGAVRAGDALGGLRRRRRRGAAARHSGGGHRRRRGRRASSPPEAGAVVRARRPGDASARSLRRMLFDHPLRAEMAEAAWQAGQALPSWAQQAQDFARALGGVDDGAARMHRRRLHRRHRSGLDAGRATACAPCR